MLLTEEDYWYVTRLNGPDIHGQVKRLDFREPSVNLGVGWGEGLPPHVTGAVFLKMFDLRPGSPEAYALTSVDFAALARAYGKMGGLDRVATIVKRVRGERPDKTLFPDGGATWQGSYTADETAGADTGRSEKHREGTARARGYNTRWAPSP